MTTDVYFTWFGPPLGQRQIGDKRAEPATFGVKQLAARGLRDVRLIFCCQAKYKSRFEDDIPPQLGVNVVPVEDLTAVPPSDTEQYALRTGMKPSIEDPRLCIQVLLDDVLLSPEPDPRRFAFLKDAWSLYVLAVLGGYHLDCGCAPLNAEAPTFPEPEHFAVYGIEQPPPRRGASRYDANNGVLATANFTDMYGRGEPIHFARSRIYEPLNAVLPKTDLGRYATELRNPIDVWAMRSPMGDKSALAALEFYLRVYFEIRGRLRYTTADVREVFRRLIITSAVTGVCLQHPLTRLTLNKKVTSRHLMLGPMGRLPGLGIRKFGFQTHRN